MLYIYLDIKTKGGTSRGAVLLKVYLLPINTFGQPQTSHQHKKNGTLQNNGCHRPIRTGIFGCPKKKKLIMQSIKFFYKKK